MSAHDFPLPVGLVLQDGIVAKVLSPFPVSHALQHHAQQVRPAPSHVQLVGSLVPVTVEKWFLIITTTPGGAQANPVFSKLSFATSKSKSKDLTTDN